MMNHHLNTITVTLSVFMFITTSTIAPGLHNDNCPIDQKEYEYCYDQLDIGYIYSITENLSNIIFTEYTSGEIAKGRAYGSKGEHKAAQILYENMSALGLYTYKEQITNTDDYPQLTYELEIEDYYFSIDKKKIDSYIAPVWFKTSENNNSLNHTYNYTNLKVISPPINPLIYLLKQKITGRLEPFVIIIKDKAFYPYTQLLQSPLTDNFYFQYYIFRRLQGGIPIIYSSLWNRYLEYCKGLILYDFNEDTHDMILLKYWNNIPYIFINGTEGKNILDNKQNVRVDFKLSQRLNTSVTSYNVIGQINGSDPTKTVIVDSLYDSWWCQGTADSAIGMAMVLALAKYFKEHDIIPKYTIKFIGFSGEEHGFCAGAKHYASSHSNEHEDILYMVDLNQLGFRQDDPKLVLNIIGNKLDFLQTIRNIADEADYENRVNSSRDLKYVWLKKGIVSNPLPFQETHPDCNILCFLKDTGWKLHHRDGLNHTEGDVLKYFDSEDVNVTGEIILNVVKYLATD